MRVAVVIPLYGQSQFVVEAVESVLHQTQQSIVAIIVNDGCPDAASHTAGLALSLAHPDRVAYLRQRNRGLSGARNAGIAFALQTYPTLEGIFLLDSDNYLAADAIEVLLRRLDADPSLDWVSPHLELFGEVNRSWRLVERFTRFRQLFENQADATALYRPALFRDGATYDENMRAGYEDWEFYLARLLDGANGATEATAIMHYRSRPHSMLSGAVERDASIRTYMRAKHRKWFLPRGRTELEHEEFPRYALIDEYGCAQTFTDADNPRQLSSSQRYTAPITLLGMRTMLELLRQHGLLKGLLFAAQPSGQRSATVITVHSGDLIAIERHSPRRPEAAAGVIVPTRALFDDDPSQQAALAEMVRCADELAITLPGTGWDYLIGWNDAELVERLVSASHHALELAEQECTDRELGFVADADYVGYLHQTIEQSTFPLVEDGRTHIGFVMPWLKLGGVEHCVLQVAKALRTLDPTVCIHLALTQSGAIATSPEITTALFESITSFAGLEWNRRVLMTDRWMASMDVAINAHSEAAFEAVERRAEWPVGERHSIDVAYLHVLDLTPEAMAHGWPIVAARLEGLIHSFLVISDRLGALLMNEGVPNRKLMHGPNAPVVKPVSIDVARAMAVEKSAQLAMRRELRILIAGRLDYQKGGRRAAATIRRLIETGHKVHVTVLGEATLEAELPDFPSEVCAWRGATNDPVELSKAFEEADVLLLLSRWEGVPLAMLDAMAHGTIVVATDVGAIAELARDSDNAYLIPCEPEADDESIAEAAAAVLRGIIADPEGALSLRQRAIDTAWALSWETTASRILDLAAQSRTDQLK